MLLALVFMISIQFSQAEMSADEKSKRKEEMSKFEDEGGKLREEHTVAMRDLRIEHLKKMSDLRIGHQREMTSMRKQLVPGNKENNQKIKGEIKAKQESFKNEEKKLRDEFINVTVKTKQEAFKAMMEKRREEIKNNHKK